MLTVPPALLSSMPPHTRRVLHSLTTLAAVADWCLQSGVVPDSSSSPGAVELPPSPAPGPDAAQLQTVAVHAGPPAARAGMMTSTLLCSACLRSLRRNTAVIVAVPLCYPDDVSRWIAPFRRCCVQIGASGGAGRAGCIGLLDCFPAVGPNLDSRPGQEADGDQGRAAQRTLYGKLRHHV